MMRSSRRNSKRSLSDSETPETEVVDFLRLHATASRVNSAAAAATDQELCKPAELPELCKPAELPDAESGFAAENTCADANDEVVEKPAQSFLVDGNDDGNVKDINGSTMRNDNDITGGICERPQNVKDLEEVTIGNTGTTNEGTMRDDNDILGGICERPQNVKDLEDVTTGNTGNTNEGTMRDDNDILGGVCERPQNVKDLEEVTTGDTGNTNEGTMRDDNDILGGILQNASTAAEESEKMDTLEISIEDDHFSGGDFLKVNENFEKIDSFFEGETKCSFTLDDVEREEGELSPDRTVLDGKKQKIMDSTNIQGPKSPPKKERVAEGCFRDIRGPKSPSKKERVAEGCFQDILNAFYNNAKKYLDHQGENISSNVLRRVKEIVRSVEDVKNNLSKENAPDTPISKNEQIFKNFIGRYLPKSRSPGRRRASNVNSSARSSNRRLRSVSREKLGVHSNTRSRYRSESRHRKGSYIHRSTRYPDRSSAAIRRSTSPHRHFARISVRKSNDIGKEGQVQHHRSDSHKTSTMVAVESKDLIPRARKDKIQSSNGGIQTESAKRLELKDKIQSSNGGIQAESAKRLEFSGKLRSDCIRDERQSKNVLEERSTVEENGTWQRISPGKQPQLSERREARKVRHLKKKEETERINSLVKRQMGIISHIVKKQNETPEVKDKDVLCNHRHTIVLDDNKQKSRKFKHSASQNTRSKTLTNLDDMEAFLDDLRDNNKKKILSDTTACNRLSRLDNQLSSLTKFFEGDKKFISRDDIDIYKYNYENKAKKSLTFSTKKSDAVKNSKEIRKPIERISSLTEQRSHITDRHNRRKSTVDKTIRDKNASLDKEKLRPKRRSTDRGLIPDVLLKNQENLRKSFSESRVSRRNPTQPEKSQVSKRESKKGDRYVSDLEKTETEPFTDSSTDESSDLILDEKTDWNNKSGKLKRCNNKRLKKLASNHSTADSEEESSCGPGGRKGRRSEISDASIVASDRERLEIRKRRLPCSRDNEIRRNGKKSIHSPPPKKPKSLTAKKAIGIAGSQRLKLLKSGLKEVCTTKGGRTLVLGDKRLAGKICLKLKSGGIYLMDGVPEADEIMRKRADEMNSVGKAVKRRRGNKSGFNSEGSPSAKRKLMEAELQEMESFLEQLRADRKEDMEQSELDLEPSPPQDREAKFLDRIRAKRKAKLMACMDRKVTDKTSAKEAKCLEAMSRRSGSGVVRRPHRRRGSTSSRTEQDKDALMKKLKAETRAILSGNKSATSSSRIRKTDLPEEEDLHDMESFLTTLRASSSESRRNKRSSTSKSFNVSFEIKKSNPHGGSGGPGAHRAVREPKVVSKMAQNILNVLRFKNRTKQSANDPVPKERKA